MYSRPLTSRNVHGPESAHSTAASSPPPMTDLRYSRNPGFTCSRKPSIVSRTTHAPSASDSAPPSITFSTRCV